MRFRNLLGQTVRVHTRRYASEADDRHLRAVFDFPNFSQNAPSTSKALFGFTNLKTPADLTIVAQKTIRRAAVIVDRIHDLPRQFARNGTPKDRALLLMAKQFDRLSDLLCSVIDPCEFIRNVHDDPDWVEAADATFVNIWNYMNTLNTDQELYNALLQVTQAFQAHAIPQELFAAYQVSLQFLRDFEKSGIHLPETTRRKYVELSDIATNLGGRFQRPVTSSPFEVSYTEAIQLGQPFVKRLHHQDGKYQIHADSAESHFLARHHPLESVRKRAWSAINTFPTQQVHVLDELLRVRAQTAALLGKSSWAEVVLDDKMAKSPQNVMAFLENLSQRNQEQIARDVEQMASLRERHRPNDSHSNMAIWDRDFYAAMSPSNLHSPLAIDPYFNVGTVLQGLSRLFTKAFGVTLVPIDPEDHEHLWHPSVQKLQVLDEVHGPLGYIYCDLYNRDNKPTGAAHYTIRCSRRTDDDDIEGDTRYENADMPALTELILPGDAKRPGHPGQWQLPIVVLSCSFQKGLPHKPSLLSWREVETLFHEVGHALHSMLGQTEYHNVSGTRCATDFVELPSILMEHFCSSPAVLKLYARHYERNSPLPEASIEQIQQLATSEAGLEQNRQITLAALDQVYHSDLPLRKGWNSTESWYDTFERFAPGTSAKGLRESGTNWQVQFTHLVGYGATYYSYLFDRSIASQVWKQVFAQSGGIDRDAGELYRREVLSYGGGKDAWQCLAALLQNQKLEKGGQEAMTEVGRWGIEEH